MCDVVRKFFDNRADLLVVNLLRDGKISRAELTWTVLKFVRGLNAATCHAGWRVMLLLVVTRRLSRVFQALARRHPLVHFVIYPLKVEREAACGDWAVAVTGAPRGYAASLTRLMERRRAAEERALAPGTGGRARSCRAAENW